MKPLLSIAAVLSFGCCAAAGVAFLGIAASSPTANDLIPITAVGLLFVGIGIFLGGMLLAAAHKFGNSQSG